MAAFWLPPGLATLFFSPRPEISFFSGRAARQLAVLWLIPPEKLASEKNLKSEEDEWNIPFIFSKERTESQSTVLNRKTKPISVFPGNIDGIKLALKPDFIRS